MRQKTYLAPLCVKIDNDFENLTLSIMASKALLLSSRKNLLVSVQRRKSAFDNSSIF